MDSLEEEDSSLVTVNAHWQIIEPSMVFTAIHASSPLSTALSSAGEKWLANKMTEGYSNKLARVSILVGTVDVDFEELEFIGLCVFYLSVCVCVFAMSGKKGFLKLFPCRSMSLFFGILLNVCVCVCALCVW